MQRSKTTRVLRAFRFKKLPLPQGDWEHSLPVEILEDIFALVLEDCSRGTTLYQNLAPGAYRMTIRRSTTQPVLRSLAGVCKVWYSMVTPMLYEEIYISSPSALASLARAVTKFPHLRPLVHSFFYSSSIYVTACVENSRADAWNLKRIYRECTHLNALAVQRPLDSFPLSDADIMSAIGLEINIEKLTRLEIELPQGMPSFSKLLFSSSMTLPALQELIVDVLPKATSPEEIYKGTLLGHFVEWPRMPKLIRLCIINWHVEYGRFRLPEHSDKLRIIELLGGNYSSVNGFFSGLHHYAASLESLTITAVHIASAETYTDLGYLKSLTELCIPLSAFARWEISYYPHALRRLILAGSPEKDFDERDSIMLRAVEKKLGEFFEIKREVGHLEDLEVVRVLVKSIWMWSLGPVIRFDRAVRLADAQHVELTFGFLRAEENTLTENLKEKLFDKFPKLERKLQ